MDEQPRARGLRVLVADEDAASLESTAAVLGRLGHQVAAYAVSVPEAAERIASEDPDLAVVAVHDDLEHALDLVDEITESASGPVVAVVELGRGDFFSRAAARGIAAFARSEDPDEVQGAIDVAMHRHATAAQLSAQVDQLESALERRSLIERAKGILMERHGVDDREAFRLLRDHARNRGRKVVDVAGAVTEGHALLLRGDRQHPDDR